MSETATIRYETYQYLTQADFASAIRTVLGTALELPQVEALSTELASVLADDTRRAA